jgi:hypothetical protein
MPISRQVYRSELIREGRSQDEAGKVMTAEFGWAPGDLRMQWSLPGMMAELKPDH